MAYQLIEFDGISLPVYNPQQNHDPASANSSILQSVGGSVDYYGTREGLAAPQVISITGDFVGELTYMVDEAGNYMVDEAGNYWIAGDAATMLRSRVSALREKVRAYGQLVRIRLDDNTREWKYARFLQMSQPQQVTDRKYKATLNCQFETIEPGWKSETISSASGSATSGSPLSLALSNGGGMPIHDATITIERSSGTITQLDIDGATVGIDLRWTGSLSSGSLVIDCGAGTVRTNGTDAYSGFSLQSGHTARGWLPLAKGVTPLLVTTTGGNATVTISYYLQFP